MSQAAAPALRSAVYSGRVYHSRYAPKPHRFSYSMFQLLLDLDEVETAFGDAWLWSHERWNIASFRRKHFLGPPEVPLKQAVRARVEAHLGAPPPDGRIELLTHVAFLGYCFNPVSFYYLYEEDGETLHSVVAEITNTPWKERHQYVLAASEGALEDEWWVWRFKKDFHVSPFFEMDHLYRWRFTPPGPTLKVDMENRLEGSGERVFDATLDLERRPLSPAELRRCLLRHPWMTGKVHAAIYWQALRLLLKRTPFFSHPKSA